MWINMNTKPKQGKLFKIDRSKLMDVPIDYDDDVRRANLQPYLLPSFQNQKMSNLSHPIATRVCWKSPLGHLPRDQSQTLDQDIHQFH